ncbi:hypothetical protein D3C79_857850 [compost metagenome]
MEAGDVEYAADSPVPKWFIAGAGAKLSVMAGPDCGIDYFFLTDHDCAVVPLFEIEQLHLAVLCAIKSSK